MNLKNHVGVFAVDPGGKTGVAWGAMPLGSKLVKEAMWSRLYAGSTTITGNEIEQTGQLASLYFDFRTKMYDLNGQIVDLVIEDFSLLPGTHTPGKEGISPVRYAWAFVGFLWGLQEIGEPTVFWQLPSQAMRYNTRKFHDAYGTWVKGREHERAAWAHVACRMFKLYQT